MQAKLKRGRHGVRAAAAVARAAVAWTMVVGANVLSAQGWNPVTLPTKDSTTIGDTKSDTKTDSAPERAVTIAPTVITATGERQRRTESSATIDGVDGREIRTTRPSHPSGIMNRIAGVHVTELSAEGHSTSIRQPLTTKPMYLYLEDGVPTRATGFFNHNALYEVNIPQAGGIEVLKGPGTALYGSDAIGGVVNVLTRPAPPRPTIETSLEGGSYGYERLLTSAGTRSGNNGIRADLNLTHSGGWRDGSAYNRQSGTVRWDYVSPGGLTARTTVTSTSVNQHDVPTLPAAQFDVRSPVNLAPIAFRTVRATRITTALQKETDVSLWSVTPYLRHDVLQLLPSWQLTYDPQTWDTRNNSAGVLTKYRRDFVPLRTRIIVGMDIDYSPGSFLANQAVLNTTGGTNGTPTQYPSYTDGVTQYNYDVTYKSVSPYVQSEFSPFEHLRLDAGLRYDVSGYDYTTKIGVVTTGAHRVPPSTSVSYRHASPKLGATYDVTPWLNVYASYRNGFRAPSQNQLFQQNSAANTVDLKPVTVNSYETGIRGEITSHIVYTLAAYDMRIHDDIITYVTPQNTREATNAGETRHRGIEGSLGAELVRQLRVDVSYSTSSQRYVAWSPSATVSYGGHFIEQAPKTLGNMLVTYSPSVLRGGRVALEWVDVGPYEEDPDNTHTYGGYRIVNAHFNYPILPAAEFFARVVNVRNRTYAELVSYDPFQKDQYTPGAPRSVYAGFQYRWTK